MYKLELGFIIFFKIFCSVIKSGGNDMKTLIHNTC